MTLPPSLGHLAAPPVFIVGMPRSGTTWVHDMFLFHPEVATVHESWLFTVDRGLAGLADPAHWERFIGLNQVITRDEMVADVRELTARWMARAVKPEHRFLVEKSPRHALRVGFINEVFPTARFIHVVRDGRDVAVSLRAASKSWAPDWRGHVARTVGNSAMDWRNSLAAVRDVVPQLGDRYLEVRYEDAIRDPFATYRRLFDFAEVPYDDAILEQVFASTDFERNYKDQAKDTEFRRGGRVGDWRGTFTTLDRLQFARAAGRQLVELGYEDDPYRWAIRRRQLHRSIATAG